MDFVTSSGYRGAEKDAMFDCLFASIIERGLMLFSTDKRDFLLDQLMQRLSNQTELWYEASQIVTCAQGASQFRLRGEIPSSPKICPNIWT